MPSGWISRRVLGLADHIVNAGSPKPLVLGIVNGTKADLENPTELAKLVDASYRDRRPTGALEHFLRPGVLSQKQALSKLELLAKTRADLHG